MPRRSSIPTAPLLSFTTAFEKFWNLSLSEELLHKYGIKQISKADKALILGGNYARANRLNVES